MEMLVAEELFAGRGEMGALMRNSYPSANGVASLMLDWSQTLLGSVSEWEQSLKTAFNIILTSHYPMFIWWGAEYANLYNDAFCPILGASKHPQFLGQSAKDCWADVWDVLEPIADRVLTTGQPTCSEDLLLLSDRNGYLEEAYFTFSYNPIRDKSGGVGGVFCAVTETTERIIAERRLRTLQELATKTAEAEAVEEVCHIVTTTLSINPYDIPFALLYQVEPDGTQARLAGTTRLEAGTVASPQQVNLFEENEIDRWNLAKINRTGKAELVSVLPTQLGVLPKGVWLEVPTEAWVIPLAQSEKGQRCGLLVVGISPRLQFDDNYQRFLELIASHVAIAIANADAVENALRRLPDEGSGKWGIGNGEDQFAATPYSKTDTGAPPLHPTRILLVDDNADVRVDVQRSLSRDYEEQLRLAQQAARAGLWNWDILADRVTWSEEYYQLYGIDPATTPSYENWIASIWEPDRERVDQSAHVALEHRTNLNVEFRIFHPIQGLRWLVAIGQTFYDANGRPTRMTGIALDITERKQAEIALRQSEEQARLAIKVGRLGTWRYHLHTNLVELDKRMREIWGEPDDAEIIPLPKVIERIHPDDREQVAIAIRAALDPGSSGTYEIDYRIIWNDGTHRWVSANGQVQFEGDGESRQPIDFFGTALDITDQKRAEDEWRRSEQRLQLAQQAGRIGTWEWNLLTNDISWSDGIWSLLGIEPGSISPNFESFVKFLHPDEQEQILQRVDIALAQGNDYYDEFRVIRQDGTIRWFLSKGQVIRTEDGQPERLLGINVDITDRKLAEAELQQTLQTLTTLINASPLPIVVIQPNMTVQLWNPAAEQLFGWSEAEVLGQPIPIVPEEKRDECRQVREAVATGEIFVGVETYRCKRDGATVIVTISAAPLYQQQDNLDGILLIFQDITQRQQAEEALRQSEERLRLALLVSRAGIWDWDIPQNHVTWSDHIYEFHGVAPGTFGGRVEDFAQLIHPDDRARVSEAIRQALEGKASYELEFRAVQPRGVIRWLSTTGGVIFDAQGNPVRMLGATRDITQRKAVEEEREQLLLSEKRAREEAERANRIKDEFLAVLSHELRSPLNPILGWAKLLQTRTLDEQKTKHALATIERNAVLQTQLIEDLLDVSRILRGKLVLNTAPVSLANTIEAALETVRLAADAKGIQIQCVLAPQVGQVMGESARLQQVIWNLLSNAVKFTPSGGTIEIRLEQINTYAQLQVKDTGKGINPEFLPHVFEYFRQEDGTTTRKFGGLGLGLAIVRHLVELHGGTVGADSSGEGQGATFTVKLPLMRLPTQALQDNPQAAPAAYLTGLQIVVVDDEPDIRDIVAFILEQAGAAVSVAASAPEALNLMEQSLPDVLICDIGMPDMDGYMLMRQIRTRPIEQGGRIPAIALTAYAGELDQKQALAAGFQQHIAKPVEPEELVRAIALLVQHP